MTETYTYNEANWVTGVYNRVNSVLLSSYEYTYYPSGNQKTKTDHTDKVTNYIYDGLGRLESEWDNDGLSIDYFYDASQNRSSMSYSDDTESYSIYYTYNANNQLTQERKRQDGVYTTIGTYTYDGNGNQLTKTGADGTQTYTYNGFNQQTGFAFGTVAASYAYNTSGIRTSKAINGARTSYLLDGGYVAAELQAGDTTPTTYLWGSNLIRREDGSDTSYYLYNAHGDVVNLTNTTGTVTKTYDYSAFGIEQNQNTTDNNPFRYCGEYYDAETGTYYLRARYYNPSVGRFSQMDTHWNATNTIYGDNPVSINAYEDVLGVAQHSFRPQIYAILQSQNLYVYAINNPVSFADHNGAWIRIAIGASVGAIGGALSNLSSQLSDRSHGERDRINWGSVLISAGGGAVGGVLTAFGYGAIAAGVTGAVTNVFVQLNENEWDFSKEMDNWAIVDSFLIGAIGAKIGGSAGNSAHLGTMSKGFSNRISQAWHINAHFDAATIKALSSETVKGWKYLVSQVSKDVGKTASAIAKSYIPSISYGIDFGINELIMALQQKG